MAVSIVINAKNKTSGAFRSIGRGLKKMGRAARRMGALFVKSFLVAGTAAVAFATKAVAAYAVQEKAEKSLIAAMNAHGEAGERQIKSLKKIASAIQDETGASDEATLAGMAKIRMLGVQTDKLEEAAKATIALKSIGMEEAAAQKAVAMAMQGNYEMLNRYLPDLRKATSETEKASVVNKLFARGYEQQKEQLNTVAGRWQDLKDRISDATEVLGGAISKSSGLEKVLKSLADRAKEAGESMSRWIDAGGLERLIVKVKRFKETFTHNLDMIGAYGVLAWAGISEGASNAMRYVGNLIGALVSKVKADFTYMKDFAKAAWDAMKPGQDYIAPSDAAVKKAQQALTDALKGKGVVDTSLTDAALQNIENERKAHADRLKQIDDDLADAMKQNREDRVREEQAASESIAAAAVESAKKVEKAQEALTKKVNQSTGPRLKRSDNSLMRVDARVKSRTRMAGSKSNFSANLNPSLLRGAGKSFSANLRRGGKDWVTQQVKKEKTQVDGMYEQTEVLRRIEKVLK